MTQIIKEQENKNYKKHLQVALILSLITIVYNAVEGLVSTYFGAADETLALFGFGVDSFVEVLSGLGIAHMVMRMKQNPIAERDKFEKTALQITGTAFYLLAAGLLIGAGLAIYSGAVPRNYPGGYYYLCHLYCYHVFSVQGKTKSGESP